MMVTYTYVQNMANTLNSCNLLISMHSPWVTFPLEHYNFGFEYLIIPHVFVCV